MQIDYDIAWQIFDEVNSMNDTLQVVDLSCLKISDAQAVTKQKIFDLAQFVFSQTQTQYKPGHNDRVLVLVCSDEHFYREAKNTSQVSTSGLSTSSGSTLKNAILECVRNELQIDHYYIS